MRARSRWKGDSARASYALGSVATGTGAIDVGSVVREGTSQEDGWMDGWMAFQ